MLSPTTLTSDLFIGFSFDSPNIEFLHNLAFFLLFRLLFLLVSKILYCVRYMVLKLLFIWIPILYEFFKILISVLNEVLSFYNGICNFFNYSGNRFIFIPREKLFSSMISYWYSDNIFLWIFSFQELKDNHCANHAIHQDNQDQLLKYNLLNYYWNSCKD